MWRQVVIAVVFAVLFTPPGEAGISRTLSYQAILRDDGGQLVDGEYDLTFTIYERPHSVYVVIWEETHADVEVENGVFDVILGSQVTLGDIFTGRRWISRRENGHRQWNERARRSPDGSGQHPGAQRIDG